MRRYFTPFDSALLVPAVTVVAGTVIIVLLGGLLNPSPSRPPFNNRGIARCPVEGRQDLLSFHALQCWFDAPGGRWRMLSRVSVYDALIVEAEATELVDAHEIARTLAAIDQGRFAEVLVYVQRESAADPSVIRRIRWTRPTGFEALQYTGRPRR
jgi:hypothetical protein